MSNPGIEDLREALTYDASTGQITWLVASRNVKVGDQAGTEVQYRRIRWKGQYLSAHRVAWALTHGAWPERHIDHINGDKFDNRLVNLRDVSRKVNNQGFRSLDPRNRLGVTGVRQVGDYYAARIIVDGRNIALGRFATVEEARDAYLSAKQLHHPRPEVAAK